MSPLPVIGITSGDPAGVGPEIVRAALRSPLLPEGVAFRVVGESAAPAVPGKPGLRSARQALAALEEAVALLRSGEIQAVVTAPVCKETLLKVGFGFPGQTEFFAAAFPPLSEDGSAMIFHGAKFHLALTTIHVPLREVLPLLSEEKIVRTGRLLAGFLRALGVGSSRIAVAGVNPHAGEGGALGSEEEELIAPAVRRLNAEFNNGGASFAGPFSPDAVFQRAAAGEFDAVLAQYHEQGLIPFKTLHFPGGVNCSWGLPVIRASPAHGTAFDIAGRGVARADGMIGAIRLAAALLAFRAGSSRLSA